MGKVKIKRKSTLIDMTAMSDVTVLLLTFFMLTSTFLQKEPTTVITPSSVSEIKVPVANLVTVLISGPNDKDKDKMDTEGKVFISIAGDADSTFSSEKVRAEVLKEAVKLYKEKTGKDLGLTQADVNKFAKINMFGVKFANLKEFLDLPQTKQDEIIGDMTQPYVGIPINDNKEVDTPRNMNEFQIWMKAIYNVAQNNQVGNSTLIEALKTGEGIAVKADKGSRYSRIHNVLDNLQTLKLNKFSLMTALKTEND